MKIIILVALVVSANGQLDDDEMPKKGCPNGGNSKLFFERRCCGTEEFGYGHLYKFLKDCYNSPNDEEGLTVAESYWRLLRCVVSKSMAPKPVTMENFAELFSSNFTSETKSAILSSLTPLPQEGPKEGQMSQTVIDPKKELKEIETIWTNYFDAEYKVCSEKSSNMTMDAVRVGEIRETWDPVEICNGTRYPNIDMWDTTAYLKCVKSMSAQYQLTNMTEGEKDCVSAICSSIQLEWATKEELKSAINYETKLENMIPQFFSKAMVETVIQVWPRGISLYLHEPFQNYTVSEGLEASLESVKNYTMTALIPQDLEPTCKRAMTLVVMARGFTVVKNMACGEPPSEV